MGRLSYNQKNNKEITYDILAKGENSKGLKQKNRERIKELDKRYTTIVSIIYNEIKKRNINYDETNSQEFNSKVDEIIETVLDANIFKRFKDDNPIDIRNALKRRLNASKGKFEEEGPEL